MSRGPKGDKQPEGVIGAGTGFGRQLSRERCAELDAIQADRTSEIVDQRA